MAKTFFETIGTRLGQKAAQAKNAFDLMGGTEEDSLRAEIRLGRDMEAALLERLPLMEDNATTKFAAQIGDWLAVTVKEKKRPFRVRVTAEREPNAIALPGGAIFVSWPILRMCQGERDEIAFLIGHEMAHIILRHALDRLVKDSAVSLLLKQTSVRHAASARLNKAGQQLLGGAYTREEELEADTFAMSLVAAAGGDRSSAEHFLDRIAQGISTQNVVVTGDYFARHPPLIERIANLRERCKHE
jgi:predicted Zn-dependent protease